MEGYQDALSHARSDKVIGHLLPSVGRPRGASSARLGYMEEGKKRIE